jgi:CHAT domain-containing protein
MPWENTAHGYLPSARAEAEDVKELMERIGMEVEIRIGAAATWQAVVSGLSGCDVAHLSLHALFDTNRPLDSALQVAPGAQLFLRDLLDPRLVDLGRLRLAVISACQSGVGDFQHVRDEAIGFFGALLAGGAQGVVGSLWPVYDASTRELMVGLMRRFLQDRQDPALALANAARALRGLPDRSPLEASEYRAVAPLAASAVEQEHEVLVRRWNKARHAVPIGMSELATTKEGDESTVSYAELRRSLAHPIHWAAFIHYGA